MQALLQSSVCHWHSAAGSGGLIECTVASLPLDAADV